MGPLPPLPELAWPDPDPKTKVTSLTEEQAVAVFRLIVALRAYIEISQKACGHAEGQ